MTSFDQFSHPSFRLIDCPICGGDKFKQVLGYAPREFLSKRRREYYDLAVLGIDLDTPFFIVKCLDCDLQFVNPRFRADLYPKVYGEAKIGKYNIDADGDGTFTQKPGDYTHRAAEHSRWVLALVEMLTQDGWSKDKPIRLLDYGSGFGYCIRVATALGLETVGVDLDDVRVQTTRAMGLNVFTLDEYADASFDEPFDLIISQSVVEHVDNLHEYVDSLTRWARKGSILFLSGITPRSIKMERKRGWWSKVMPIEHINYTNHKTMDRLMEQHGFSRINRIADVRPITSLKETLAWPLKRYFPPGFGRGSFSAFYRYTC
ncbi:class I SAM-dependent methyltransferase [Dehalococcoides mccartyi]|nr:class I SAM-dependent methyltransferase [Dehalococcoides mccartyi]